MPADARLTAAHFQYATAAARVTCSIPTCRSACRSGRRRSPRRSRSAIGGVDVHRHHADAGAVGRQHLQRREARRDHVVPAFAVTATPEIVIVPTRATPANARGTTQGRARHGDQPRQGRGEGRCGARAAAGLARHAGHAGGELLARRRSDDRALHAAAAAAGDARGRGDEARRQPVHGEGVGHAPAAQTYAQGYQVIEYPHTTRRHVLRRRRRSR